MQITLVVKVKLSLLWGSYQLRRQEEKTSNCFLSLNSRFKKESGKRHNDPRILVILEKLE